MAAHLNPCCWRMIRFCSHTRPSFSHYSHFCAAQSCRLPQRYLQVAHCTTSVGPGLQSKPPPRDLPPFVKPGASDLDYDTWDNIAVLVDKPASWTSYDVCGKVKFSMGWKGRKTRKSQRHKVGHAGTLDPMATGLLIVCMGRATKRLSYYVEQNKEYVGTIRLGETTSTMDGESSVEEVKEWRHVTDEDLDIARISFIGETLQIPPMFSAVKVDGQRLYKLARAGKEVKRMPRRIQIDEFEVSREPNSQDVEFRIVCGKGTYIRSVAHDLGQVVGCGAHLKALRRTAIGKHRVDDAWTIDDLVKAIKSTRGFIVDEDSNEGGDGAGER